MTDKEYVFKEMTKIIEILEDIREYLPTSEVYEMNLMSSTLHQLK